MLENKRLDKKVPIPLYFQLKSILLKEIETGEYPVGALIPTENELSDIFEISRTTVRQAITELVQEGHLYRVKSKGTFVSKPKIKQDFIQKIQSFNDEMRNAGKNPGTEILAFEIKTLTEEQSADTHFPANEKVIYLHRKRLADNEPIVRVETYLPYRLCSFILQENFEVESLYKVLSQNPTTKISKVMRIVEAIGADTIDAKTLGIKRGAPVHCFQTFGFNNEGEQIEYSVAHYRGDQSRFQVNVYIG
ncbi:MAG: GntR family transcriptional regulator [Bacillota bacterium]|nr:GntR family transcriptional regulator [Bacillota bacterium]